ncbi:MAG: homocysteine S-methyltransferase [Solirubrobacteraceae bacterium]|jgi:S-methylmethionine-dependent homocysteine/selenocysteine methylase|nr:homocysteine S-methyltransferase [Solirubrobacteraceae bacterium]
MAGFPQPQPGVLHLTEGGQETELMYKHGHELPEFAMYPLLDDPRALADLTDMYTRYLEVAAAHGFVAVMGGLDYRASPDWASKLGISSDGLAEFQLRSIEFLRDVARPFQGQVPRILIAGIVGPRGDAYGRDRTITAAEAEEYHGVQIETLSRAGVDLVSAMTFNNVPEGVGLARAAAKAGLPLSLSFMVDPAGRLLTGPTLKDAVEAVDEQAGDARPDFYGINCSHPIEFEPALVDGPWLQRIRSLRPNASMAEKQALCQIGHLEAGDPEALGAHMGALARRLPHIDVWGGCCGTWDDHLRAIARRLRPLESVV